MEFTENLKEKMFRKKLMFLPFLVQHFNKCEPKNLSVLITSPLNNQEQQMHWSALLVRSTPGIIQGELSI